METRKRYSMRHSYQKPQAVMCQATGEEARDVSRLITAMGWIRLCLCQPGTMRPAFWKAQLLLLLLCWEEIPPSVCPTGDFMTGRAASTSEQLTLANGAQKKALDSNCSNSQCYCFPWEQKQSSTSEPGFGLFPGLCLRLSSPGWT